MSKIFKKINAFIKGIHHFITIDIWHIDTFAYKQLRKIYLMIHGFIDDKCLLRASALTYTTLLSIVPLFAAFLLVIKGVGSGGEDRLIMQRMQEIMEKMLPIGNAVIDGQKASELFVGKLHEFASKMSAARVGGAGAAFLVVAGISLLKNMEKALNNIWGIKKHRRLINRLVVYWAMITLTPIFLLPALSTSFASQSQAIVSYLAGLMPGAYFSTIIESMFLPLVFLTMTYTLLYMIMPNTKVKFKSALIGGIVASILFILAVKAFGFSMSFTGKLDRFKYVYGAIALLPLMLLFIYLGWIVFLFGAEVSFADQNAATYSIEQQAENVSTLFKEKLVLTIMHFIGSAFKEGRPVPDAKKLYDELKIPIRLINEALHLLEKNKILTCVDNQKMVCIPYKDLEKITIGEVLDSVRDAHEGQEIEAGAVDPMVNDIFVRLKESATPVEKTNLHEWLV